jgi:hypothetical protein
LGARRRATQNERPHFPYDPKSVGAAFTRACHILGIQDLRFHDLRHEANGLADLASTAIK